MTVLKNNIPAMMKKSDQKNSNKKKLASLKSDLLHLYDNLERYFVIDHYYVEVDKENPNRMAQMLLSKLQPGHEVLEIGLNPGILSLEASLKGVKAYGIDSAPMHVVIAENLKHIEYDKIKLLQKFDDWQLPVDNLLASRFIVANYDRLDFEDNQLHMIFSNGGIEECEMTQLLKEMLRCLVLQGQILLKIDYKKKLLYELETKSGETNVLKLKPKHMDSWIEKNNVELLLKETEYSGLGKFIVEKFPFMKESSTLSPWGTTILYNLRKI